MSLAASQPAAAPVDSRALIAQVYAHALGAIPLTHYTGVLLLQGLVHHAMGETALRVEARARLLPFVRRERDYACNIPNYLVGGNGTAAALAAGWLPEAHGPAAAALADQLGRMPRDADGFCVFPHEPALGRLWIDCAWAVAPFGAAAGRALGDAGAIDDAIHQTVDLALRLRDPTCGLLHQSLHFAGPGRLSADHWSRGNGWGAMALAGLVEHVPEAHPRRREVERLFTDLLAACLAVQDAQGLWHQEMTDPAAWVETSGSGLILHALGVALERGLAPGGARAALERGLAGYLGYIGRDGSVFHTCTGCLCPGQGAAKGSIASYLAVPHRRDDPHAAGPVVLAFAQALRLGIAAVSPL